MGAVCRGVRVSEVQTHIALIAHVSASRHGQLDIDGDRTPIPGRGGGSFANHSPTPNVELCIEDRKAFVQALAPIMCSIVVG